MVASEQYFINEHCGTLNSGKQNKYTAGNAYKMANLDASTSAASIAGNKMMRKGRNDSHIPNEIVSAKNSDRNNNAAKIIKFLRMAKPSPCNACRQIF